MHSQKLMVRGPKTANTLKKFSISDREILDKRVKTNPRYAGVRPRTDTGFNTQRRQELEHEIRKYYKVAIWIVEFALYAILYCLLSPINYIFSIVVL